MSPGARGSLSTQSHPAPEDPSGWWGAVARGTHTAFALLEASTGNRSQSGPRPGACPRKPPFPARKIQVPWLLPSALPPPGSHPAQRCQLPGISFFSAYILLHLLAQLVALSGVRLQQVLGAKAGKAQGQPVGH